VTNATIMWRRLDVPGHESARFASEGGGRVLAGSALFLHDGLPCRLDYSIACSPTWQTVSAHVQGWIGQGEIEIAISVDASRGWRLNGSEVPAVGGCFDLDFNFTL
jgi:hypothetical protein